MEFTEMFSDYTIQESFKFMEEMSSWSSLQRALNSPDTTLTSLKKRIKYEIDTQRRAYIVERLLQRYNKLHGYEVMNAFEKFKLGSREDNRAVSY
jgi:hypothetical protein